MVAGSGCRIDLSEEERNVISSGSGADKVLKGSPIYFEAVERRTLGESALDFLALNTPPICNYRCEKCSTGARSRQVKDPLTLDETKKLLHDARSLGALGLAIAGEGEPLLYKEFPDVVKYAHEIGLVSVVATNGGLLTPDIIEFLFENDVTLTVSLDTLDKDKYEKQCGAGKKFESVLENIGLVRDIYKRNLCRKNGFDVYRAGLHVTINSTNVKELDSLRRQFGDDLFFSAAYIANHGEASVHKQLTKRSKGQAAGEYSGEEFLLCRSKSGFPVCGFFYYGLAVGYNGEVLLADHALETEGIFGNVRRESLKTLKGKVSETIGKFYGNGATCYCPVRDRGYADFIRGLKNEK